MAAIAYVLLLVPEVLWEPLSDREKTNLSDWLGEINRYECSLSNWQFFCILVNCALQKLGRPYSRERLETGLSRIDSYYDTDGWYRDGANGQKDYYNGFAIVFYSLVYASVMKTQDMQRCEQYRRHALEFGQSFVYWFDEQGPAVAYGRSQTYRFAQCAFFSLCAALELPVFPEPVLKGILYRHLDWWQHQPVFDNGTILSIGYAYPNLLMSEDYNAPGSPYWCMKAFAFLRLPEDHSFWNCEPAPLPRLEEIKPLPQADALVQRVNGMAVLYPAGLRIGHAFPQMEEKYAKFAYCSRYAFSVARSQRTLEESAPDSVLSFRYLGHTFVKGGASRCEITAEGIRWDWSPFPGIQVQTELIPCKGGHERRHTITSTIACEAYDAGFALPEDCGERTGQTVTDHAARVETESGFCEIQDICGNGTPLVLKPVPNTSLLFPKSQIPMIRFEIRPGVSVRKRK